MTKSKNSINYPPLFASAKYYSKEDFQFPVTAVSKIVTSQTVLKKNSGITLLYFRDSNGKIVVNTREYPVSRGTLMCLGAYHYFQFFPGDALVTTPSFIWPLTLTTISQNWPWQQSP